jgi:hypothetical protein
MGDSRSSIESTKLPLISSDPFVAEIKIKASESPIASMKRSPESPGAPKAERPKTSGSGEGDHASKNDHCLQLRNILELLHPLLASASFRGTKAALGGA